VGFWEKGIMRTRTRSREGAEWQALYNSTRWRKLRLIHLASEPLCRMCKAEGRITPATICDHITPHKGNVALFYDSGNFASLCKPCHDRHKQSEERTGKAKPVIGLDGWPIGSP
jgi:5-methylcytosine-specific restriction endonuclease McrA